MFFYNFLSTASLWNISSGEFAAVWKPPYLEGAFGITENNSESSNPSGRILQSNNEVFYVARSTPPYNRRG